MKSAEKYLHEVREMAYNSSKGWMVTVESVFEEEYDDIQFKNTLASINYKDILQDFESGKLDHFIKENSEEKRLDLLISKLAYSLMEDIKDCTQNKYSDKWNNTYLSFIPYNDCTAFCSNVDDFLEPLDGYIICINQGLYYCLNLISKAFVVETVSVDLKQYKNNAPELYNDAIGLFLEPKKDAIKNIFFEPEKLPPQNYGHLSAFQSSMAMMIMQFIGLHEFGHIVNGDLTEVTHYKSHLTTITGNEVIEGDHDYKKTWAREYSADEFAIKALSSRAASNEAAWANFLSIYYFFKWLDDVETKNKKPISKFHPPPMDRANNLLRIMKQTCNMPQDAQRVINNISMWSDTWPVQNKDRYE